MTSIPNRDAKAPVRKGKNADPACPNPAIHPMLPDRSQGGRTFREWFITRGYMGPKSIPTPETATAPPTRDGTNQTTSSNLNPSSACRWEHHKRKRSIPNGQQSVEEYDPPFSDLKTQGHVMNPEMELTKRTSLLTQSRRIRPTIRPMRAATQCTIANQKSLRRTAEETRRDIP